jgi:hypothetical protein
VQREDLQVSWVLLVWWVRWGALEKLPREVVQSCVRRAKEVLLWVVSRVQRPLRQFLVMLSMLESGQMAELVCI